MEESVRIITDITVYDFILFVFLLILLSYLVFNFIFKYINRLFIGNVNGYLEYCKDPLNILSVKISKCVLYNLFVPGKMKFKVYLDDLEGGEGKKIIFKCGRGNICMIENMEECQSFSPLRINGFLVDDSSMYDLEKRLKIIAERDPEKTIVIYKTR